jgi:hypothetical protein
MDVVVLGVGDGKQQRGSTARRDVWLTFKARGLAHLSILRDYGSIILRDRDCFEVDGEQPRPGRQG